MSVETEVVLPSKVLNYRSDQINDRYIVFYHERLEVCEKRLSAASGVCHRIAELLITYLFGVKNKGWRNKTKLQTPLEHTPSDP